MEVTELTEQTDERESAINKDDRKRALAEHVPNQGRSGRWASTGTRMSRHEPMKVLNLQREAHKHDHVASFALGWLVEVEVSGEFGSGKVKQVLCGRMSAKGRNR